jgi:hypothetical protein
MNYLTPEQVLFIHSRVISETSGTDGVRDVGRLESAVARPRATYDNKELYPDVFTKAAALMHSLIKYYPFLDGNKCTTSLPRGFFTHQRMEADSLAQSLGSLYDAGGDEGDGDFQIGCLV